MTKAEEFFIPLHKNVQVFEAMNTIGIEEIEHEVFQSAPLLPVEKYKSIF